MNGIEKITGQIDADVQKEIDAALDQARAQAQEIQDLDQAPGCRIGFALVELWEELENALASREAKPEETGNFLSQEVASWLTGG